MSKEKTMGSGNTRLALALGGAVLLSALSVTFVGAATSSVTASADNQYVGAEKCKSCHGSESSGNQYAKWTAEKHHKAMTTLSSPEAATLGAKAGVTSPATDAKCVSCHQTGAGEPANHFAKGFDPKAGVQCESCHGAGQKHVKARLAASDAGGGDAFGFEEGAAAGPQALPAGEILRAPTEKRCVECHNTESPSYKAFTWDKFHKEIAHPDPRRAK